MSDFSREAMGTCRQHGRFSTDDGGCPSCDYEELTEDPLENCVCDVDENEELEVICDNYIEATTDDKEKIAYCDNCGHLKDCHE